MPPKKGRFRDIRTAGWERHNARQWDETSTDVESAETASAIDDDPVAVEASEYLIDFDDETSGTPHCAPESSRPGQLPATDRVQMQVSVRGRPPSVQHQNTAEHCYPPPRARPHATSLKARGHNVPVPGQFSGPSQPEFTPREKRRSGWGAYHAASRLADSKASKGKQHKLDNEYLGEPTKDVEIAVEACYLWPMETEPPSKLFGLTLEALNYVRTDFRVWIVWNAKLSSLVITSRPWPEKEMAQNNVTKALKAVRETISHAKARMERPASLYLAVPPVVQTMRSSIRPIRYRYPQKITIIELEGALLSDAEKVQWNIDRDNYLHKNEAKFSEHILRHLYKLSAVKGWMRMRVHFGHLHLSGWPGFFKNGVSYAKFLDFLDHPGLPAWAKFDKSLPNIDVAKGFGDHKITKPDIISTTCGTGISLEKNNKFTHMLCLFFESSPGVHIRMKVEIDSNSTKGSPEYQLGSIKFFKDNNRNKHIEIFNLDIEKKIDWAIEVITDNTIRDPQPEWKGLIERATLSKTADKKDSLGLAYPGATLPVLEGLPPIESIVIKSTTVYSVQKSVYSLEMAVYRRWIGHNTKPEPEVQASVSMYHSYWDDEMRSLEGTAYTREWDRDLSQLFIQGEEGANGIKGFLADVEAIRGYLSDASKAYFDGLIRPAEDSIAVATETS